MSPPTKYFSGTGLSRYLTPAERSWDEAVYQSAKPLLDSELVLSQEVGRELSRLIRTHSITSGWLRGPANSDPADDWGTGASANQLTMAKRTAYVAGLPVVVEYTATTTAGTNVIQLGAAPVFGGSAPDVKRTDFMFLEVWRCVVSTSPRATATVEVIDYTDLTAGDEIVINGVSLVAVAGAAGVDEFQIGGTNAATATNIYTAINDAANSFDGICTATISPTNTALLNLRAADAYAGAAGNALTLSLVLGTAGAVEVNGGAGPTTFSGGSDTSNKPTQATIYRHGNTLAPSGVNLTDDIADPVVGSETTKRVQIQYRIRVTGQSEAVNYKTENGFSNSNVLARGTQSSGVAGYPFVRADGSTVSSNSSAAAYGTVDTGLWIAGNGSEAAATALGTVDGYVYAIPIGFVFRRNDAYNGGAGGGFTPLSNTNGALPQTHAIFVNPTVGTIAANTSDRPDGRFHDRILPADVLDLRHQVLPAGLDLKAEVARQMAYLLDGTACGWAIDGADKNTLGGGSGDVGTKFLVCNEIGRSAAKGGSAPASGDTNRGDSIADFDHIRRRFADWPVVERVVLPILPDDDSVSEPGKYVTKATGGYTTWQEGDIINLDLSSLDATGLGDWADAPSGTPTGGGNVSNLWPSGTTITDVLRVIHDDGNYTAAISKTVQIDQVIGLGTDHVQLVLGANNLQANGGLSGATYDLVCPSGGADIGSPRRIFVELEISYPVGAGTTDTVDEELSPAASVYPVGPILENDVTQRPDDWEDLIAPVFTTGRREVSLEYIANDGSGAGSGTPITDAVVSDTTLALTLPRRIYGSGSTTVTVTDQGDATPRSVDTSTTEYGSSSRKLYIQGGSPFSGTGQTLCSVEYFAQDPLPNWGADGYQVAVYYRSLSPQTLGVVAGAPATFPLPSTLTVEPLVMSDHLWTGIAGAGSVDQSFPYSTPLDQIAVNGDVAFSGEWVLQATAPISVADFNASVGLLRLNQLVAVDPNSSFSFTDRDVDAEFRAHYKVSDTSAYRPTAMAQPLSGAMNHKVFFPFLARATADSTHFRAGEVMLLVVSRYATMDAANNVQFADSSNEACVALYRTKGLFILAE